MHSAFPPHHYVTVSLSRETHGATVGPCSWTAQRQSIRAKNKYTFAKNDSASGIYYSSRRQTGRVEDKREGTTQTVVLRHGDRMRLIKFLHGCFMTFPLIKQINLLLQMPTSAQCQVRRWDVKLCHLSALSIPGSTSDIWKI